MIKYTNKTVIDYINGEDLGDIDIEELENNPSFMRDVINLSNDKEMYSLCSDTVKNDYSFIKFLIRKFSYDTKFISKIAKDYINNTEDEVKRFELLIIMCDLLNRDSNEFIEFRLLLLAEEKSQLLQIELAKIEHENEPDVMREIGETGFYLIYDMYNESEIVTNYFAKEMLNRLLQTEDSGFEDFLHQRYKNVEELEQIGIKKYLIDYISCYDPMLASYISGHISILKDTMTDIEEIKRRWNTYGTRLESLRYTKIFNCVQRYMESIDYNSSYREDELLYYVAHELGVFEQMFMQDPSMYQDKDLYEIVLDEIEDISTDIMSYNDLYHYNNLKKIVLRFLSITTIKELKEVSEEFEEFGTPTSPKIIDFNAYLSKLPNKQKGKC